MPNPIHPEEFSIDPTGRLATSLDRLVPVLLGLCAVISFSLLVFKPIAHGHNWQTAPTVTMYMIGIWLVYRHRPSWFADNRWLLGFVLAAGLAFAFDRLTTLTPNGEVIRVYRAVFASLDSGVNPYDCNCIPHRVEEGGWRNGNFNYPPTEIWPYYLVYGVFGVWNRALFTATLIALGLGACLVLRSTFPRVSPAVLACYFPILVFFELKTNSATALFMVALVVWLIRRNAARPGMLHEALLALVFSVGLLTKFIVIPVFAAFYWSRVRFGRARSYLRFLLATGAVIGLAALQMAPFGVSNVFRETILFNLVLDTRAALTTYYPNVVSGLFYWISLKNIFPFAAVVILAASVVVAPLQRTFSSMLAAAMTFIFVATTPESQFIPIILYLALAGSLLREEDRDSDQSAPDASSPPAWPALNTRRSLSV